MRSLLLLTLLPLTLLLVGCSPPAPVTVPAAVPMEKVGPGTTHRLTIDVPEVGRVLCSVNVAESYDESTPAPLTLLLHYGYQGTRPDPHTGADMIDMYGSTLSGLAGVAIAPDVVGGDWTRAQNEKAAVWLVKSAMETYNIDPKKVIITGYSMGGEGTWFIGSRHQDLFTAAIPIAAPVSGGKDWKIPVRVIHSDNDDVVSFSAAQKHADAIRSAGGNVEFFTANGLSHYDSGAYRKYFADSVDSIRSSW